MKLHLISCDIWGLNMKGETLKLKKFLKGLNPQANVVCLQKHKLSNERALNIG
jgi:hypothetical protein